MEEQEKELRKSIATSNTELLSILGHTLASTPYGTGTSTNQVIESREARPPQFKAHAKQIQTFRG